MTGPLGWCSLLRCAIQCCQPRKRPRSAMLTNPSCAVRLRAGPLIEPALQQGVAVAPLLQRGSKTSDLLPLLLPGQLHAADPASAHQLCEGPWSPGACPGIARQSRCVVQAWAGCLPVPMQRHPGWGASAVAAKYLLQPVSSYENILHYWNKEARVCMRLAISTYRQNLWDLTGHTSCNVLI